MTVDVPELSTTAKVASSNEVVISSRLRQAIVAQLYLRDNSEIQTRYNGK